MLQPANTNWSATSQGQLQLASANTRFDAARAGGAYTVSSIGETAILETHGDSSQTVAMVSTPSFGTPVAGKNPVSLYSADTAVTALALVGAWMVLLGGAMLSRNVKAQRTERETL